MTTAHRRTARGKGGLDTACTAAQWGRELQQDAQTHDRMGNRRRLGLGTWTCEEREAQAGVRSRRRLSAPLVLWLPVLGLPRWTPPALWTPQVGLRVTLRLQRRLRLWRVAAAVAAVLVVVVAVAAVIRLRRGRRQ